MKTNDETGTLRLFAILGYGCHAFGLIAIPAGFYISPGGGFIVSSGIAAILAGWCWLLLSKEDTNEDGMKGGDK